MSPDLILSMGQKMLELAFIVAAPVLLVTFLVGLIVSILQSTTQIQEMTLSYIPKLIAACVVVLLLGAWVLNKLLGFTKQLIVNIPVWLR